MNKYQRAFVPLIIFFFTIILILFIRQLDSEDKISIYKKLVNYNMPDFWKPKPSQLTANSKNNQSQLLVNTTHVVTRQQLGRNSWQLLHMISGTMPDKFDAEFQAKTNLFLNLFAQYYPCKVCGTHFLQHLKQNPFQGRSKSQFMHYMCGLHNIVNADLKKEKYDCSNIQNEWSCGCGSE